MKKTIFSLVFLSSLFLVACNNGGEHKNDETDSTKTETDTPEESKYADFEVYYNDFKAAVLADDVDKIVELTYLGTNSELTEQDVRENYEYWLDGDFKSLLEGMEAADVVENVTEEGTMERVIDLVFESEELDEEGYPLYASAVMFYFNIYNGEWKLTTVLMAG